jgi:hypothetical protein
LQVFPRDQETDLNQPEAFKFKDHLSDNRKPRLTHIIGTIFYSLKVQGRYELGVDRSVVDSAIFFSATKNIPERTDHFSLINLLLVIN